MSITGSMDFDNRTFSFNNIVSTNELISITNNQLTLAYTDENNNLVQIRKDVNNLMNTEAGDFISTCNILDNNNLGGFAKSTKDISRKKYHIGKTLVGIDWNDNTLNEKYNISNFVDSNNNNRQCVRIPCIIFQ